jgi:hypothetical protein
VICLSDLDIFYLDADHTVEAVSENVEKTERKKV